MTQACASIVGKHISLVVGEAIHTANIEVAGMPELASHMLLHPSRLAVSPSPYELMDEVHGAVRVVHAWIKAAQAMKDRKPASRSQVDQSFEIAAGNETA